VLALFNAGDKRVSFVLPEAPGAPWQVALSTQEGAPARGKDGTTLRIDARSIVVLTSAPEKRPEEDTRSPS